MNIYESLLEARRILHGELERYYEENGMGENKHPYLISPPQTRLTRVAAPPGTCVLPEGSRIGDAARDACLERLRELHSLGYLDPAVFSARCDAALAAQMQDELDYLVRDLPELLPGDKPSWMQDWLGVIACLLMVGDVLSTALTIPLDSAGHWVAFGIAMAICLAFSFLFGGFLHRARERVS